MKVLLQIVIRYFWHRLALRLCPCRIAAAILRHHSQKASREILSEAAIARLQLALFFLLSTKLRCVRPFFDTVRAIRIRVDRNGLADIAIRDVERKGRYFRRRKRQFEWQWYRHRHRLHWNN